MDTYEKKYKEALERAKKGECLESIFPELKNSKIREEIIKHLISFNNGCYKKPSEDIIDNWVAWLEKQGEQSYWKPSEEQLQTLHAQLNEGAVTYPEDKRILFTLYQGLMKIMTQEEKQGEQKPADKVEPKFKVGDWIVSNRTNKTYKIDSIDTKDANYIIYSCVPSVYIDEDSPCFSESMIHFWTIKDAKDGDVLICGNQSFLFKCIEEKQVYCYGYIWINEYKELMGFQFCNQPNQPYCHIDAVMRPATNEHRDALFAKMKEAGYEWDAEKRELKKIEQKPNFCHHEVDLSDCSEEYRKAYYDGWNNCNQQHAQLAAEQKPAWSEEDERMINSIIKNLDEEEWFDIYQVDWLKSIKDRVKK